MKKRLLFKCPRCKEEKLPEEFKDKKGRTTSWCKACRDESALRNPSRKEYKGTGKGKDEFSKKQCHGVPASEDYPKGITCKKMITNYRCEECWSILRGRKRITASAYSGEEYGGSCG